MELPDFDSFEKLSLEEKIKIKKEIIKSNNIFKTPILFFPDQVEKDYYFVSYYFADYKEVFCDLLDLQLQGLSINYNIGKQPQDSIEEIIKRDVASKECRGTIVYISEAYLESSACYEELMNIASIEKPVFIIQIPDKDFSITNVTKKLYKENKITDEMFVFYMRFLNKNFIYTTLNTPAEKRAMDITNHYLEYKANLYEGPKAYLGEGNYIFVSYSHKDADRVNEFISILQTKYNVWFDEGIHYGKEWDEEIVNKIDGCTLFIYAITPNSLESKNCKDEIVFAKDNDIPFINVLFDDIELPKLFKFRYGRIQMLKYFEYHNKMNVLGDLERRSEEIKLTLKDGPIDETPQIEIKRHIESKPVDNPNKQDYALFTFEKEISIFSINDAEKDRIIESKECFDDGGNRIYRLVMLPGDSMNNPVNKVEVTAISISDENDKGILKFWSTEPIDCRYSHNVLNRGYNCINIDFKTDADIPYLFNKVKTMRLVTRITSIFGTTLDVEFEVILNGKVNIDNNPDVKEIPDLATFKIHHCHYKVIRR